MSALTDTEGLMYGSPSVGSQPWRGFLFSPVAVFSSSLSQLFGVVNACRVSLHHTISFDIPISDGT